MIWYNHRTVPTIIPGFIGLFLSSWGILMLRRRALVIAFVNQLAVAVFASNEALEGRWETATTIVAAGWVVSVIVAPRPDARWLPPGNAVRRTKHRPPKRLHPAPELVASPSTMAEFVAEGRHPPAVVPRQPVMWRLLVGYAGLVAAMLWLSWATPAGMRTRGHRAPGGPRSSSSAGSCSPGPGPGGLAAAIVAAGRTGRGRHEAVAAATARPPAADARRRSRPADPIDLRSVISQQEPNAASKAEVTRGLPGTWDHGTMYVEVDGQPPTVEVLQHRALANYGHFTSLQVRDRSVRGLDLHLRRLSSASRELFDVDLDRDQVRRRMRAALDRSGGRSCSMRVDVFQPPGADDVSVMVSVRSPVEPAATLQRLQSVVHQRPLAHIKHVGTFAQIYHGRRAEHRGFDEALFVGSDGAIYEGSVTNIGFVDSDSVVWTEGPRLAGITQQLLDASLPAVGLPTVSRTVRLSELTSFRVSFLTNSVGVVPVGRVDSIELSVDHQVMDIVRQAYLAVGWDHI